VREAWIDSVGVRAYLKIDKAQVSEDNLIHWVTR